MMGGTVCHTREVPHVETGGVRNMSPPCVRQLKPQSTFCVSAPVFWQLSGQRPQAVHGEDF